MCSGQLLISLGLPDGLLPGTSGDSTEICAWKSEVQNKSLPGKCKLKLIQNGTRIRGDTHVSIHHIRVLFVLRGLLIALLNT